MIKIKFQMPNELKPSFGIILGETTSFYLIAHNPLLPDIGEWIAKKFCFE